MWIVWCHSHLWYIYMHICIAIYIYAYISVFIYIYAHMYVNVLVSFAPVYKCEWVSEWVFVCMFFFLCARLSVRMSFCPSSGCQSICLCLHPSVCLFAFRPVCLHACLFSWVHPDRQSEQTILDTTWIYLETASRLWTSFLCNDVEKDKELQGKTIATWVRIRMKKNNYNLDIFRGSESLEAIIKEWVLVAA